MSLSLSPSLGVANTPYVTWVESRCLAYRVQVLPRRFTAYGRLHKLRIYTKRLITLLAKDTDILVCEKAVLSFFFKTCWRVTGKMSPTTNGDYYIFQDCFPGQEFVHSGSSSSSYEFTSVRTDDF